MATEHLNQAEIKTHIQEARIHEMHGEHEQVIQLLSPDIDGLKSTKLPGLIAEIQFQHTREDDSKYLGINVEPYLRDQEFGLLLVDALHQRGVSYRMRNEYEEAEADFGLALDLSTVFDDRERELTALGDLIDIYRTWDRKHGGGQKRLGDARMVRDQGSVFIDTLPTPSMAKVNFYINAALLSLDEGNNLQALNYIGDGESEVGMLVQKNVAQTTDGQISDPYLLNRLARVYNISGVIQCALGESEVAITYQKSAYFHYVVMGDVRGIGNTAIAIGDLLDEGGDKPRASDWYEVALNNAVIGEKIIDQTIHDLAIGRLAQLEEESASNSQ